MKNDMNKCEQCGTSIIDGECSCGHWMAIQDAGKQVLIFRKALLTFAQMEQEMITMDIPEKNVACLFFQGDEEKCDILRSFIKGLMDTWDESKDD